MVAQMSREKQGPKEAATLGGCAEFHPNLIAKVLIISI